MKLFTSSQIRQLDQLTIKNEPIASIDLMERAADAIYEKYLQTFSYNDPICIVAGPGNNGGDALALARMFLHTGLKVKVHLIYTGSLSNDCQTNKERLLFSYSDNLIEFNNEFTVPSISNDTIIIDGLFGTGLSRPLTGIFAEVVNWMNQSGCRIVSIDIPSGLEGENNVDISKPIVKASHTFSLQFPKLALLFAENESFVGKWDIIEIGLLPEAIRETASDYHYLEENYIKSLLKKRSKYSHKGTYGHALIVAGSRGMAGASVLSGKAALRSGAGLVTVHGCTSNRTIIQTAVPEIIFQTDQFDDFISDVNVLEIYNSVAVGPGIGTKTETADMLRKLLGQLNKPCVLDADALNIISIEKDLLQLIPKNSLLTPHPKEFERLFGKCNSSYERMMKAQEAARQYEIIIVLKGANTLIAMPDGKLHFNSTGNPGMATGGSGDVLTGILVGLLAQAYTSEETALLGVFIHGKAGDLALENESEESLIAEDIISHLGKAFKSLINN